MDFLTDFSVSQDILQEEHLERNLMQYNCQVGSRKFIASFVNEQIKKRVKSEKRLHQDDLFRELQESSREI